MADSTILWFRQDLRLADNPALVAAMAAGPVLPLYVLDDEAAGEWAPGGAARWWLHHSLAALARDLERLGAPLMLLRGRAETLVPALAQQIGATSVHAGRLTEPYARERDRRIAEALAPLGARLVLHTSGLLVEPHRLRSGSGQPYAVYTPFSRAIFALGDPPEPLPAPGRIEGLAPPGDSLPLAVLGLLPRRDWADGFAAEWKPGEAGAAARLARFVSAPDSGAGAATGGGTRAAPGGGAGAATGGCAEAATGGGARPAPLNGYEALRNFPGEPGTSALSPHLHLGEVSPRAVWHAARAAGAAGAHPFLKEILWREFSHHLLWHRPELPDVALRAEFARFPWAPDATLLRAWQRGETGYPIVDAGMRQLWTTGWMHNRVRMIVASFLTKHLLQPWQAGAAWFWDTLVDADLAANSASWQWVAGCGSDAAPYFRVFNPSLQSEKFDPEGRYIRRFLPELAGLPAASLHRPWEAARLPGRYPAPIIAHEAGRARALAAYAALRAGG